MSHVIRRARLISIVNLSGNPQLSFFLNDHRVKANWLSNTNMNSLRIAHAALRARSAIIKTSLQRRGYADAVSDKVDC